MNVTHFLAPARMQRCDLLVICQAGTADRVGWTMVESLVTCPDCLRYLRRHDSTNTTKDPG